MQLASRVRVFGFQTPFDPTGSSSASSPLVNLPRGGFAKVYVFFACPTTTCMRSCLRGKLRIQRIPAAASPCFRAMSKQVLFWCSSQSRLLFGNGTHIFSSLSWSSMVLDVFAFCDPTTKLPLPLHSPPTFPELVASIRALCAAMLFQKEEPSSKVNTFICRVRVICRVI